MYWMDNQFGKGITADDTVLFCELEMIITEYSWLDI